jgi:hypothetical protein
MSGIILDTNVVSELRKPEPHRGVLAWTEAQAVESLHLTSITIGELALGVELLALGRRREELRSGSGALRTSASPDASSVTTTRPAARSVGWSPERGAPGGPPAWLTPRSRPSPASAA